MIDLGDGHVGQTSCFVADGNRFDCVAFVSEIHVHRARTDSVI